MSNDQKPATLDDVVAELQKNHEMLEEIKVWTKINGVEKVQNILTKHLNLPEKIIVYHQSDGKTTREIGTMCSLDPKTISNYWRSWYKLGIMKTEKVRGGGNRYIKIFDLDDYGIKIPTISIKPKQKTTTVEQQTVSSVEGEHQNGQ